MATARKTTSKTTKTNAPAPVTREELTQITKALTGLAKEVKSLKAQLAEAKGTPAGSNENLVRKLKLWASRSGGPDKEALVRCLDSKKI